MSWPPKHTLALGLHSFALLLVRALPTDVAGLHLFHSGVCRPLVRVLIKLCILVLRGRKHRLGAARVSMRLQDVAYTVLIEVWRLLGGFKQDLLVVDVLTNIFLLVKSR